MTDHEQIMICAERYALGRRTYIVGIVTQYIHDHLKDMSDHCKHILIEDLSNPLFNDYGDSCDKEDWMKLLDELKER